MKTAEEFETFYKATLLPRLEAMENERTEVVRKKRSIISTIACIAVLPPMALIVLLSNTGFNLSNNLKLVAWLVFAYVMLCFWIYRVYFSKTLEIFVSRFKREVITELVKFVDENLHFNAQGNIDERSFVRSSIFTQEPSSYRSEDSVRGTIGKTRIKFAEINSLVNSGKNQTTLFKGLFFMADFNKEFNTLTVVVPDHYGKDYQGIGQFFQKMNSSRDQLIKLEDPEFESYFAVYGKDQVEARYILSTALMARIVDFRKKSGIAISLSFRDNRIYLALPLAENLFEPAVETSLIDPVSLKKYFEYVSLMAGIVEDLNLNTRIWQKADKL